MADKKSVNGKYDYDLIVIGGGSGGLAASKEATACNPNLRVACFDYVTPSHQGTTWGLGGTCVNVGCIPKKLMHYSSLLGKSFEDAKTLGWKMEEKPNHDWHHMVESVNMYIQSLNYGYKNALMDSGVEYINALAKFEDAHTVVYTDEDEKKEMKITSERFIIAVGGRPVIPDIKGAHLGITSDDIFWWQTPPGRTLVAGAGYIAMECAGFLHEMGHEVTVMARNEVMSMFDRQVAAQVGEFMERQGVRFLVKTNILSMERKNPDDPKSPIVVTYQSQNFFEQKEATVTEEFETVLFATGRKPCTDGIGLDKAGVKLNRKGKIPVDEVEATSAPHIFAIGDVTNDPHPELTPVAIQAGQLLARRLFSGANRKMDYVNVPTTVFTPLEYGTVGLSQEQAEAALGKDAVEVFSSRFGVLESAVTYPESIPTLRSKVFTGENLYIRRFLLARGKEWTDIPDDNEFELEERARKFLKQPCLAKLVCDKKQNNKVVGFHYIGPNAGEITQGFALAVKLGATKEDFDQLVGIHPTAAEEFTTLTTTLSSGEDWMKKGGC